MKLFPLYHWSPTERRKSIIRHGLKVRKPHVVHSKGEWQAEYLCFSKSPSHAWGLSGGMGHDWHGVEEWDLWMVWSNRLDRPQKLYPETSGLSEYRIRHDVPKRDIWYVGSRSMKK